MKNKLWQALKETPLLKQNVKGIGERIHHRFKKVGGFNFEQPKRSEVRKAPDFSENSE
jgi:hypothetical protein